MNVWIINNYAMPPKYEMRMRTFLMAKYLKKSGYGVKVFTASTIHNTDINLIDPDGPLFIEQEYEGLNYVHIKVSKYKGNGFSRVKNMLEFSFKLIKVSSQMIDSPDVIICDLFSMLSPMAYFVSWKKKAKFILEIRDLWPESIFELTSLKKNSLIGKVLQQVEKWIYKKADKLIFTMEGHYDYIIEQGWEKEIPKEKCHYINNGVDLETFDYNKKNHHFEDIDLDNTDTFKVIYTGSIRIANDIDYLIDAAKLIKDTKIIVLIYGSGTEKERLEKRLIDENINNVIFKGFVDKKYIPYILSKANLNTYALSPTPLYRFGLSMNKSFDYFASGKPVLATANSGYSIIDRYKCGICLENYSAKEYANEMERFSHMPNDEYKKYCKNARKAAEDFDFKILTKKLIEVIEG